MVLPQTQLVEERSIKTLGNGLRVCRLVIKFLKILLLKERKKVSMITRNEREGDLGIIRKDR